jgi:hypothetical protein
MNLRRIMMSMIRNRQTRTRHSSLESVHGRWLIGGGGIGGIGGISIGRGGVGRTGGGGGGGGGGGLGVRPHLVRRRLGHVAVRLGRRCGGGLLLGRHAFGRQCGRWRFGRSVGLLGLRLHRTLVGGQRWGAGGFP